MSLLDGMSAAGQAMSAFTYQSEVASQNASMPYTKTGYVHQVVDVDVHPFTSAMFTAGGGTAGTSAARTPDNTPGGVKVSGQHGVQMGERDGSLQGVTEMLDASTAYDLSEKSATMFKSMAIASLDIGRG